MTNPLYHPPREILLDYADGSLGEPAALVIATHLAFCPACRHQVADLEAIGGALLEEECLNPVSDDCLRSLMARLDEPALEASKPVALRGVRPCSALPPHGLADLPKPLACLPEPLRSYLEASLAETPWQPPNSRPRNSGARDAGGWEIDLRVGRPPVRTRLIGVVGGGVMPRPSPIGMNLNLVLAGGYHDPRGTFRRGDLVLDDPGLDYSPAADNGEECVYLCVTDASLRLSGVLSRSINPFVAL